MSISKDNQTFKESTPDRNTTTHKPEEWDNPENKSQQTSLSYQVPQWDPWNYCIYDPSFLPPIFNPNPHWWWLWQYVTCRNCWLRGSDRQKSEPTGLCAGSLFALCQVTSSICCKIHWRRSLVSLHWICSAKNSAWHLVKWMLALSKPLQWVLDQDHQLPACYF